MTPVGDWGCVLFDLKRKNICVGFTGISLRRFELFSQVSFFCGGRLMRLMLNKNWRDFMDFGHLVGRNLHFWNWRAWLPEHQENVWHVMFLFRIGVSMRDKDCIELSVSASWCFRGGHDTCFACKGNLPAWVRHPLSTACSLKCKRKISLQFLWVEITRVTSYCSWQSNLARKGWGI